MAERQITEQQIREQAYLLWEAAGKPEGSANRYWDEAEHMLRQQPRADASLAPATAPKRRAG